MSCKQYADQWEAYTLGLLSDEKKRELSNHLETCTACQAEVRQHQQARDVLVRAFEDGPSDALVQKTLAHIRARQAKRSSWLQWGVPLMVGMTAAILIVVIRPGQLSQEVMMSKQSIAPAKMAMDMTHDAIEKKERALASRAPMMKARAMEKISADRQPVMASAAAEPAQRMESASDLFELGLKNPIHDRSIYNDLGIATDVAKLLL